jgi:hypothetical protein
LSEIQFGCKQREVHDLINPTCETKKKTHNFGRHFVDWTDVVEKKSGQISNIKI